MFDAILSGCPGAKPPGKARGFGGRKPPNLVTGTQTPTWGIKFQPVTRTLSATRLGYSNPAGLLSTGQTSARATERSCWR